MTSRKIFAATFQDHPELDPDDVRLMIEEPTDKGLDGLYKYNLRVIFRGSHKLYENVEDHSTWWRKTFCVIRSGIVKAWYGDQNSKSEGN